MKNTPATPLRAVSAALLALAMLAPAATAQQAPAAAPAPKTPAPAPASVPASDDVHELSTFEVTTSRDIGYQSTNAAEAMRMNMALEDIPMNVTIFNQQFLDDILARDTADVLDYDASIVQTDENDQYMARGFGVNATFLDGFRQISGLGPQSVNAVERVEIIKGPAAVLFGTGGMGGVVNRISKRPQMRPATNARILAGQEGSFGFRFDDTRPIPIFGDNKLAYRLNVVWEESTGYFGNMNKLLNIAPSLMWQPTKRTQITAQYIYDLRDRSSIWPMPVVAGNYHGIHDAGGNWHDYGDFKRNYAIDGDVRHDVRHLAALDLKHRFSQYFQLHAQAQRETRVQHRTETSPEANFIYRLSDAVLMTRGFRDRYMEYDSNRVRAELISQFNTGPVRHRLLGGFAWDYMKRHQDYKDANDYHGGANGMYPNVSYADYLENPGLVGLATNNMLTRVLPMNVFEPWLSPPVFDKSKIVYVQGGLTDTNTKNTEFYVNEVATLFHGRFLIQGGARFTDTSYDHTTKKLENNLYTDHDGWSFGSGLVWHANEAKTFTIYGSLNKTYSPNFMITTNGVPPPPTTGLQEEIGVKFKLLRDRLNGLICVYNSDLDDVPFHSHASNDDNYIYANQRSKGVEVSLHTRPVPEWDIYGSYAYTDSWVSCENFSVRRWNQPMNAISLMNKYSFKKGFMSGLSVNLGILYKSERDVEDINKTKSSNNQRNEPVWTIPEAWRFDLILNYRVRISKKTRMNISFKVKNLFNNSDIVASADNYSVKVEPGRMWEFFAGVNF